MNFGESILSHTTSSPCWVCEKMCFACFSMRDGFLTTRLRIPPLSLLCPHSRCFGSYFDVIFLMYLVSSGFSFKPTSSSSSSSSTQFSQEWARRKVVVKHSIKSNPPLSQATQEGFRDLWWEKSILHGKPYKMHIIWHFQFLPLFWALY